jgi:hypothetical protein
VRNLYRFGLCLLMAMFFNEMLWFNSTNTDVANFSLMVGFLLLLEKLLISITIEHIQNEVAKAKEKKKL